MIPNLQVAMGSFARSTDGSQNNITVGFDPKVILFYGNQQTTDADGADCRFSMGAHCVDGTSGVISEALTGSGDTYFTYNTSINGRCYHMVYNTPVVATDECSAFATIVSNGFNFDYNIYDANAPLIHWIAFGGEAVRKATCGYTAIAVKPGLQQVVTGFPVDTLLGWMVQPSTLVAAQDVSLSVGMATNVDAAAGGNCISTGVDDNAGTTNTMRNMRAGTVYKLLNTATGTYNRQGSLSGYASTGFTLNNSLVLASPYAYFLYVAMNGVVGKATAVTQPTSTGSQATTGLPFQPKFLFSLDNNRSAGVGIIAGHNIGMGFGDGTSQLHLWQGSTDNVTPPVNREDLSTTRIVKNLLEGAGGVTVNSQASMTSLDTGGFTWNWTTVDSTLRSQLTFALAAKPIYETALFGFKPGKYETFTRSWAFDADEEGWTVIDGIWDSGTGHDSTGGFIAYCSVRRSQASLTVQWSGTFEDLGAPAGCIVDDIRAGNGVLRTGMKARGSNGITIPPEGNSQINSLELQDEFGAFLLQIIGFHSVTYDWRDYGTSDETDTTHLGLPSNTPVILYFNGSCGTGNSAFDSTNIAMDEVSVTFKYRWQ